MIEQVRLKDLGVIADATLPMGPGFTAVTGETGAGKTMVVTGLGLLMGQRADSGTVRSGAAQAVVEGIWNVEADGPAAGRVHEAGGDLEPVGDGRSELYLSRTIQAEGRSRAAVGGRAAPAGVLVDLAAQLVAVHGQSDQLRLTSKAAQRDALDRFGGDAVGGALAAYREAHAAWGAIQRELSRLVDERDQRRGEAERLREELAEIEAVAPEPGEDQRVAARAERLANAEELREAALAAREALSSEEGAPDVGALLADATRALERAGDPALARVREQLADLIYRASDAAVELSSYLADLDEEGPQELAAVEERRAALAALARRHGSLDEAIALQDTGSARLAELDDDGERVERLRQDGDAAREALDRAAGALTAARRAAAEALGEAATAELHALAMPDARLVVDVSPGSESAHGHDEIAFLLAPHPGADPRPVAKGASGGELSRVMLAIEVVVAQTDPVPTFIFDEVDAGIGGAAAIEVGRRLARLAESSQVIAVTHLAQVAAFATNHLNVVKSSDGSITASSVTRLEGDAREAEMARLLSGMADSDAALTHARELLSLAARP
ncbi:DNA repair protein RecN [Microbacterium excoecariae]|uniref:DNA repair protein RecN n=1 Tax=Microbacterium excoecariae TaxID=2715210 RepID=UPI00140C48C2|nr:DNA repair protein RecN [Microbacterium excoecariae]NHI16502.1 DNA repair protein RecN [Microbacterium excoecariae]